MVQALRPASLIPGIRVTETGVELPRNTWALPEAQTLFEIAGHAGHAHPPQDAVSLWEPKRRLFAHQIAGASFLVQHEGGLNGDDMGLGKTTTAAVALETAAQQLGGTRIRLVVAPKFTRASWLAELLALGAIEHEDELCILEGTDLDRSWRPDAPWMFVHYEILPTWWSRLASLGSRFLAGIIFDEIHWLKNGKAKRSQAAISMAGRAPIRIGLSGTPIANRPAELWHPLSILTGNQTWGGPLDFRIRYCGAVKDGFGHQDQGPTNVAELRQRLETVYYRRTATDAGIELPSLSRVLVEAELNESDRRAHDGLLAGIELEELVSAILQHRAGRETLRILNGIRKITSQAKQKTTLAYVQEALEQGQSAVVFTWERRTAEHLTRRLAQNWWAAKQDERICECVHGGLQQSTRDGIVRQFQDRGGVLVSTLDALKEGVTLHRARLVVLHDLDWVPSNVLQGEKRIHRIGQSFACISAWVVARDSIDTIMSRLLLRKAEHLEQTLGLDAAARAADELDLHDVAGLASFEDELRARIEQWRAA